MNKIIVIKLPNNKCAISASAPEMFDKKSGTRQLIRQNDIGFDKKTDDEILKYIAEKAVLPFEEEYGEDNVSYRITTQDQIPSDRTFREAWHDEEPTEMVDVDLKRATEIKKDQFRKLREPLMTSLDIEYQRADEEGDVDKKTEIIEQKVLLRDVTDLDLPENIEELKSFLPDILLR